MSHFKFIFISGWPSVRQLGTDRVWSSIVLYQSSQSVIRFDHIFLYPLCPRRFIQRTLQIVMQSHMASEAQPNLDLRVAAQRVVLLESSVTMRGDDDKPCLAHPPFLH